MLQAIPWRLTGYIKPATTLSLWPLDHPLVYLTALALLFMGLTSIGASLFNMSALVEIPDHSDYPFHPKVGAY